MEATQAAPAARIGFRIEPELKEAAARAAKADRRNLSQLALKALEEYLERRGFWSGRKEGEN